MRWAIPWLFLARVGRTILPADAIAEDRPQNLIAGADGPAERAGDLAEADARTVVDWYFHNSQLVPRGFNLHLDSPTEIRIAHADGLQRAPGDRAERAQIRVLL